jgi:hypothetical protein
MREIFHGWRRKLGCITLLLALALTGLWIRSRSTLDEFHLWKQQQTSVIVASEKACLVLGRLWNVSPSIVLGPYIEMDRERTISGGRIVHAADLEIESRWGSDGLGLVKRFQQPPLSVKNIKLDLLIIPYWCVVWPLTLLSAWLLLSKPRQSRRHGSESNDQKTP